MSIESHLASARNLVLQKRYDEAIAEYQYVLQVDPDNPEALSGLEKLTGATPLAGGCLAGPRMQGKIKTNFFEHQAAEISAPITGQGPVKIVLLIVGAGVLFGLYQALMFFLNFDKIVAMKNVEVRLHKPVLKNGEAFVNVDIGNYNPAPIRDATFSFSITSSGGSEIGSGKVTVPGFVPAGDSRTFTNIKLGAVSGAAGKMHAELSDLKYGPKPSLSPELTVKFVEAAGMHDKDAVDAFKQLVQLAPEFAPAYVGLGLALAANNEMDLALKAFDKALKIDPEDVNAHYNMGVALFYKGDREGAKQQFEEALKLEPGDPGAAKALADVMRGEKGAGESTTGKEAAAEPEAPVQPE